MGTDKSLALAQSGLASPENTSTHDMAHAAPAEDAQAADVETGPDWNAVTDAASQAVEFAIDMWKVQAGFRGITVMGSIATGPPGCLHGPDLASYLSTSPQWAGWTGELAAIRDAIVHTFSDAFASWQQGVSVPGLSWYPAFENFPGPLAPPTPNLPTPLVVCPSADLAAMLTLSGSLLGRLDPDVEGRAALQEWADRASTVFLNWLSGTPVANVMAHGPVPTFAPPFVPVGRVIHGTVIEAPGHLLGGPRFHCG